MSEAEREIVPEISQMVRGAKTVTAVIANAAALSGPIQFDRYSMLCVHMPAVWTAASIGFYVCSTEDGTYTPLYDRNGVLVQIVAPAVDKSYVAPAEVTVARWLKLWSQDGAGSSTNQGAARSLVVDCKA
jgi:hypothetical protein